MFVTCGFEARATHIYSELTGENGTLVALDHGSTGIGNYDANRAKREQDERARWIDLDGSDFAVEIEAALAEATAKVRDARAVRVFVDVSSCSRSLMASLMLRLSSVHSNRLILTRVGVCDTKRPF